MLRRAQRDGFTEGRLVANGERLAVELLQGGRVASGVFEGASGHHDSLSHTDGRRSLLARTVDHRLIGGVAVVTAETGAGQQLPIVPDGD